MMGIKAIKREQRKKEMEFKKIIDKALPDIEEKYMILDIDMKMVEEKSSRADRNINYLKRKFDERFTLFVVIILMLIAVTGFNTGYILVKLLF